MKTEERLDVIVTFRVSPEIFKQLEALAAREERKLADVVRRLCLKSLSETRKR